MGNFIPPVSNRSEVYISDAGVPVSVDLLRARYRGCKSTRLLACSNQAWFFIILNTNLMILNT